MRLKIVFLAGLLISAPTFADFASTLALAKTGNADAQFSVGRMYASGNGVPLDNTKAFYWYLLAKHNGSELAENRVSYVKHSSKIDVERAYEMSNRCLTSGYQDCD